MIAGNHELSFDPKFASLFTKNFGHTSRHADLNLEDDLLENSGTFLNVFKKTECHKSNKETTQTINEAISTGNVRQYLTNCVYLEDAAFEVYGIKIYGSPWCVKHHDKRRMFCHYRFTGNQNLEIGHLIFQEAKNVWKDGKIFPLMLIFF